MAAKTRNDKVDEAVSAFFFKEGIPFSKVESQAFKKMVSAVKCSGPAYQPPNRKRLSGSLLDD